MARYTITPIRYTAQISFESAMVIDEASLARVIAEAVEHASHIRVIGVAVEKDVP